ncbi:MAG: tRNA 4-thiouridine(8) synthase ThiI [Planctomycetota bacterium]|nr:MAG: tRNA 4-thiouridine(8) synthase ThiI [Planctomycetota bacterium]
MNSEKGMTEHLPELVLIRPGEIALKGKNQRRFEQRLLDNLRAVTSLRPQKRARGRYYLGPVEDAQALAKRCSEVFGVMSSSPALRVESDLEVIRRQALALVKNWLQRRRASRAASVPFRVTVKRQDKRFAQRSQELAPELGALLLESFPVLRVDLHQPELELGVEIRSEGSFLFVERIPGPGGLPVGSSGRVLVLLSGGIDSPVAAWQMMKRGCTCDFVHFDGRPFTGPAAAEKVRALAERLRRWQGRSRLHFVPFSPLQLAIRDSGREDYRTLLYRRSMLRIAEQIALEQGHEALVTGDSLGQVASQTLSNLRTVDAALSELPVLRPLLSFDKEETIAFARRIGSFDISIRPHEDACTLFQPERPATTGRARLAETLEREVGLEALTRQALEQRSEEPVRGAPELQSP